MRKPNKGKQKFGALNLTDKLSKRYECITCLVYYFISTIRPGIHEAHLTFFRLWLMGEVTRSTFTIKIIRSTNQRVYAKAEEKKKTKKKNLVGTVHTATRRVLRETLQSGSELLRCWKIHQLTDYLQGGA